MGVERTISNFIRALRNAEVRVSTAETLDAMSVVDLVGYEAKRISNAHCPSHCQKPLTRKTPSTPVLTSSFNFKTCAVKPPTIARAKASKKVRKR